MKEISELILPDGLRYAEDHEWARMKGDTARVGIDDYAQDQLGEIVYVELPEVGKRFAKGDVFGSVESVKAVAELFMPIGGEILSVNTGLGDSPDLVNKDPYDTGWMVEVKVLDPSEFDALMTKDAYLKMLEAKGAD